MRIVLNLIPDSVLRQRETTARRRVLVGVPLIGAAVLVALYGLLVAQETQARQAVRESEARLAQSRPRVIQLTQLQSEVEEFNSRRQELERLLGQQQGLSAVLEEISRLIPKDAWLLSLRMEGGTLTAAGIAMDLRSVAQFADGLTRSRVLDQVQVHSLQQAVAGSQLVTQFQLSARLKGASR